MHQHCAFPEFPFLTAPSTENFSWHRIVVNGNSHRLSLAFKFKTMEISIDRNVIRLEKVKNRKKDKMIINYVNWVFQLVTITIQWGKSFSFSHDLKLSFSWSQNAIKNIFPVSWLFFRSRVFFPFFITNKLRLLGSPLGE